MSAEHAPAHTVGIVYQERSQAAHEMAERLATQLRQAGREVWLSALLKGAGVCIDCLPGTDVVLVLGGDGTILSAARMCASDCIPILGVNFGRVGFLTELEPAEVEEQATTLSEWRLLGRRALDAARRGAGRRAPQQIDCPQRHRARTWRRAARHSYQSLARRPLLQHHRRRRHHHLHRHRLDGLQPRCGWADSASTGA